MNGHQMMEFIDYNNTSGNYNRNYWTCDSISSGSPASRDDMTEVANVDELYCKDMRVPQYDYRQTGYLPPYTPQPYIANYSQEKMYQELGAPPVVRVVKRRNTANKKERRRTHSINTAFAELRDCIPNVPADTKLSKIKTLRLATCYISHLMTALSSDDPNLLQTEFRADLVNQQRRTSRADFETLMSVEESQKKGKGRTGWPQHVWALELKQEQNLQTA